MNYLCVDTRPTHGEAKFADWCSRNLRIHCTECQGTWDILLLSWDVESDEWCDDRLNEALQDKGWVVNPDDDIEEHEQVCPDCVKTRVS